MFGKEAGKMKWQKWQNLAIAQFCLVPGIWTTYHMVLTGPMYDLLFHLDFKKFKMIVS